MARILSFSDGFTSAIEPTKGSFNPANKLMEFIDDAAFVTYKGAVASQGDVYLNTTSDKIRFHNGVSWVDAVSLDASGNLTLDGDLTVNGTTTTVNTDNLEVVDKNITVNKDGSDASAQGAGLTVERIGDNGSLVYDSAVASKWKLGDEGSESEIVDVDSSQTLTNKNIITPTGIVKADIGLSNVDNTSDATKNAATATLTNKTLTTPVINSPTGLVKADVGLSNVDNTSDATKNSASVVLTNKDIDGGTASNTSRITLPKAAKTTLDALTRKAGTVVFDTTSGKPYYDDGTTLNILASLAGAGYVNLVTKTNDYTASAVSDDVILVDASAALRTITLPAVSGLAGKKFTIKKIDSAANNVVIDGNGSETIAGALTFSLYVLNATVEIICTGSAWEVLSSNEKISASYYMATSYSTSTTLPIQYNTKLWDTHSRVTTGSAWKFTAPIAGRYKITTLTLSSGAGGGWLGIYKNGVLYQRLAYHADLQSNPENASATIELLADDYFDIRAISTFTALGAALSSGPCTITIEKE